MIRKSIKRALSILLALIMMSSAFCFSVEADVFSVSQAVSAEGHKKGAYSYNGFTYDVIDNEAVIMYSPVSGNIAIPNSINGYPVTQIADYAFDECDNIKTVTMGSSVKRIGNYAFWFCKRITKVTVGSSVEEIGECAFQFCMLLEDISLPDTLVKLGTTAFDDTAYYKSAANWENDKKIIYIGKHLLAVKSTYKGAYTIKSGTLSISDCAFSNCTDITSVTIPGTVISIGSAAFDNCSSLKKIIIPNSVKYIGGYAFQNCTSLTDITIGTGVERIDCFAFENTGYYKNSANWSNNVLYVGSWLVKARESYSGAFTSKKGTVGIADWAFHNCTGLTSVTMNSELKYIGVSAFNNCSKISKVVVSPALKWIGENAFIFSKPSDVYISDVGAWCGICFENLDSSPLRKVKNVYVNNARVTEIVVPDTVKSIGKYAFANFTTLTLITIPNSVRTLGDDFLYNCKKAKICCNTNSVAYTYAKEHSIGTVNLCKHIFDVYVSNNDYTCTKDGTKTAVCKLGCGAVDTVIEKGTALGHLFETYTSDNNATCMSDGTKSALCERGCGERDSIPEAGTRRDHSYGEYVYDDNATCMADGTESAYCVYGCGVFLRRTAEGTLSDHRYSHYIANGDATCTKDGTKTAFCDFGCGVSVTVVDVDSKGHQFTPWTIVVMPTADKRGMESRSCKVCAESESRSIDKVSFSDVSASHWYANAVTFVVAKGYMKGMSETVFSPNSNITREQFVLILANIAGVDTEEYKNTVSGFEDVKTGQWYSGAVAWAVKEGYVSGMSATKFGRGQSIQRAALARMLYNYASKNGINVEGRAELSAFGDAKEFEKSGNAWMVEPVQWAVDAGVISGMTMNGKLCVNPKGTATRAQASVMLMNFDALIL